MLAHHHHHHHQHHQQQQHQNHKHKGGGKNNQYANDNTSSDSNSSNEDDDENDRQQRDKGNPTGRSAYNKTFGGHNHRGNPNGVEHTQQQLSLLSTNADPTTTMADSKNIGKDDGNSAMTMMTMIDPQINLSLVHHVPSSSLVLPLHATATAALLQSVVPLPQQQQHPTWDSRSTVLDNTPPKPGSTGSTADTNHHGPMSHGPQHPMSSPAVAPPSDHTDGIPPPAASLLTVEHYRHLMEVRGQHLLYVYVYLCNRLLVVRSHQYRSNYFVLYIIQAVRPFFTVQGMMYPHYVPYPTAPTTTFDDSKVKGENVPVADNGNSTNPSSSEGFTSFFTTTTDESGGDKKATTKVALAEEERVNGTTPEDGITDDNASMAVLARAKRKYAKSIQRHQNLQQKQLQTMGSSSQTTSTSSSDATSLNDRDQNLRNYAPVDENNHHHHRNNNDSARTMSRMVTDVSSSNPTTTSGSGSGDNGMNTTTGGSGSGTGSNQGSSGSGNDGKGSSEEQAKEDSNSGGDGMNGSDGSSNKINNHRGNQVIVSSMLDDSNAAERQPQQNQQKSLSTDVRGDGIHVASTPTETATREQKMLVKKRKRIVMRREYEAQQRHMSSSDSSGDSTEHFFPPGRPLTLDQVLVFSKIPRYAKPAVAVSLVIFIVDVF